MSDKKQYETRTVDNAVFAFVDHQPGLLVNCRDQEPMVMKNKIMGLCELAKTCSISSVEEGYDVYAVVDASGSWNELMLQASMHRMSQAGD